MQLLTVQGKTFNLAHLVNYTLHVGQREVGTTSSGINPVPVFADFRYAELVFTDGSLILLQAEQTEAFLAHVARHAFRLDLDQIEAQSVGNVVVHGTVEGGDIVLPSADADDADARRELSGGFFPPLE
jgi:hypothetical protein